MSFNIDVYETIYEMLLSDPLANFKTFSERVSYIKTTTSVGLCLSRDFSASTDTKGYVMEGQG